MDNINSMQAADAKIKQLQTQLMRCQKEIRDLEVARCNFVDNPEHPINKKISLDKDDVVYLPTLAERRHYGMKFGDICRNFDVHHMPLFFADEQSCGIFDNILPILNDIIKFKVFYESGIPASPTEKTDDLKYVVGLSPSTNSFVYTESDIADTNVHFKSEEVAKNCCLWLNYKYKRGSFVQKI